MTSRITVTCPQCNAKLAVGSENAGKRLRCPKCQTTVQVPDGNEDDVVPPTQETTLWKVVVGTKKGGPFGKVKLRQLVDGEKLQGEAFVRDDAGATDWCEVQTIDWLFDFPERRAGATSATDQRQNRTGGCRPPLGAKKTVLNSLPETQNKVD